MNTMKIDFGPEFDWFEVLGKLNKGHEIDYEDNGELRERAGSWPICACGQLCTLLPRKVNKRPEDGILTELGCDFSRYVEARDWQQAIYCMQRIEKRATELLKDMGIPVVIVDKPRRFVRKKVVLPKTGAQEWEEKSKHGQLPRVAQ